MCRYVIEPHLAMSRVDDGMLGTSAASWQKKDDLRMTSWPCLTFHAHVSYASVAQRVSGRSKSHRCLCSDD